MKYVPLVYESTKTVIDGYALGSLPDAIECKVTEERNGEFFLNMKYSAYGINSSLLSVGRLIVARPNIYDEPQAFRIASIEKKLDGMMDIVAYHISYDLSQVVVMPFTASTISAALTGLVIYGTPSNAFTFSTDKTTSATFTVSKPTSLRSLLVGTQGSLVDVYGGELRFNNWSVELLTSRGQDRNVQIAYGKNLSGFKETDKIGAYDSVIPYAIYDDVLYYLTDTTVCATAPVVHSGTSYGYPKTLPVDFSDQFTNAAPTQTDLFNLAQGFINRNNYSATANFSTEYVDLSKFIGSTERVDLCDRVYISVKPYDLYNFTSKVISVVYDCLTDTYESVSIGDRKITLADTLAEMMR